MKDKAKTPESKREAETISTPSPDLPGSESSPLSKVRIFISTGEVSGDLQGGLLIEALKRRAIVAGLELEIIALGGAQMAEAGATLLNNTSGIGSMGFVESLPYVLPTLQIQRRAKKYLQQYPPNIVVLIDYGGVNLSLGRHIKQQLPQVPVVYYIAPQMWVWWPSKEGTSQILGITDLFLAIFPEEARYFQKQGGQVSWVGHPLVDRMQGFPSREKARATLNIEPEQIAIALVPASRSQELKYLLPVIFQAAKTIQTQLPQVHFWIPLSLETYRHRIEAEIKRYGLRATLIADQTSEVLAAADLAITKSGTVNLELALLDVPQVVLYRLSPLTLWIGRTFMKFSIPFMSPPNLVDMKPIVPELLQEQATPENIVKEALSLLNPARRKQTLADYKEMRQSLGEVGVCDRAAQEIFQLLV